MPNEFDNNPGPRADEAPTQEELSNLRRDLLFLDTYAIFSDEMLDGVFREVHELTGVTIEMLDTYVDLKVPSPKEFLKAREIVNQKLHVATNEDKLFHECCDAYNRNDQSALRELLPNVLKVTPYRTPLPALHGVTFRMDDSLDSYVERVRKIFSDGIFPTEDKGFHIGLVPQLRPIYCTLAKECTHGVVYFEIDPKIYTLFRTGKTFLDEEVLVYSPRASIENGPLLRPFTDTPGGDLSVSSLSQGEWREIGKRLGCL